MERLNRARLHTAWATTSLLCALAVTFGGAADGAPQVSTEVLPPGLRGRLEGSTQTKYESSVSERGELPEGGINGDEVVNEYDNIQRYQPN